MEFYPLQYGTTPYHCSDSWSTMRSETKTKESFFLARDSTSSEEHFDNTLTDIEQNSSNQQWKNGTRDTGMLPCLPTTVGTLLEMLEKQLRKSTLKV